MDLQTSGVVIGVGVCAALYTLQKGFQGTSMLLDLNGGETKEPERGGVEATPELEHFLEDLGELKLLGRLTEWGAKTPADLKHLIDDDFDELGIAEDNAIRAAITRL